MRRIYKDKSDSQQLKTQNSQHQQTLKVEATVSWGRAARIFYLLYSVAWHGKRSTLLRDTETSDDDMIHGSDAYIAMRVMMVVSYYLCIRPCPPDTAWA